MTTLSIAQAARDRLSDKRYMRWGANSFVCIQENENVEDCFYNYAVTCYGYLKDYKGHAEYFATWPFIRRHCDLKFTEQGGHFVKTRESRNSLKDFERHYLDYIIRRSIFSPCFQTKNHDIIFNRGVIFKTHLPAQIVYLAAGAVRYVNEQPNFVQLWNVFKEEVSEDEAFFLAHLFYYEGGNATTYKERPNWGGEHKVFPGPKVIGKYELKQFLDRNMDRAEELPSFKEKSDFTNVSILWSRKNHDNMKKAVIEEERIKLYEGQLGFAMPPNSTEIVLKSFSFDNIKEDLTEILERNTYAV